MARPCDGDVPRNVILNCKVTPEESDQLADIVQKSNISKSKLIRQALKIIFARASEAQKKTDKKVREMFKNGNFSMDSVKAMTKIFEDELERELNQMAYKEVVEAKEVGKAGAKPKE